MLADLKGKTALVTGAGKKTGIGFAIASKLAEAGAHVVIADLPGSRDDAAGLAAELSDAFNIRSSALELDVTQNQTVEGMAAALKSEFGTLDILCNNAGAVFGVPNAIHTYPEDAWLKTIDVNLHGFFRVSKAVVPLMLPKGGSIVNVASRAAKVPPLFNGAYAVAKAGIVMLTKVMARELAGSRIRVNAVCPGVIRTDFTRWRFGLEAQILNSTPEAREADMLQSIPLGRLGDAIEVANLAAFLASEASSYMTGQAVNVTGGQLMEL